MLASAGCDQPKPPGELVGAYHIQGTLKANSCGHAALPAEDTLAFDVEVRKDDKGRGIWLQKDPPPRYGQLDENGKFSFELENDYDVDTSQAQPIDRLVDADPAQYADPTLYERLDQQGMQHCRLVVTQTVHGVLLRDLASDGKDRDKDASTKDVYPRDASTNEDPAPDGSDLSAANEIAMHAASGSHCEPVLTTYGGPFEALPCAARYELSGELATN